MPDGAPSDVVAPDGSDTSGVALASNVERVSGRLLVIVLDDLYLSPTAVHRQRLKRVVTAVIDGLAPADRAAMLTTSGRRNYHVEFTSDAAALRSALDAFLQAGVAGMPDDHRLRVRMETLIALATSLEGAAQRRKAIVLVGEGDPPHRFELRVRDLMTPEGQELTRDFERAAQRAHSALYLFDVGLGTDLDLGRDVTMEDAAVAREMRRTGRNDVRVLSDNTGGHATIDTDDFDAGVRRMLAESGQYYLLGYYTRAPLVGSRWAPRRGPAGIRSARSCRRA